jgi:hypothetical protein
LTSSQKVRLRRLEPRLRASVNRGDYDLAKRIVVDIQSVLRPTGHETRLMQAKIWVFEAAMEAGRLEIAVQGLSGVRQKVARRTRLFLEATALLAICYIRQRNLDAAAPLMQEVLTNDAFISSPLRRREFRGRVVQRFDEEGALSAMIGRFAESMDANEVHEQAVDLVRSAPEDEIFARVGDALPADVVDFVKQVDDLARRLLPKGEVRYLPPPRHLLEKDVLGRTAVGAVRRVLWRALCDPDSDLHRMWFAKGMGVVFSKPYIATAVTAALAGGGIGLKALAVSAAAFALKFGIEVFCVRFGPTPVMGFRQ